jgi:chorismate dehydratase
VYPDAEIISVVPSKLGTLMKQGEVDIALLSSIELLRNPEYSYLPEICISSDGAVGSVLLFSHVPIQDIKTVALDQSSLTSVILIKILFSDYWKISPDCVTFTPPVENGLKIADAALAIGDAGLVAERQYTYCYDLGAEWKAMTGLPFVFALWITRQYVDKDQCLPYFLEAKRIGLSHISEISKKCAAALPVSEERFRNYFIDNLRYDLKEKEIKAMQLFFDYAKKML